MNQTTFPSLTVTLPVAAYGDISSCAAITLERPHAAAVIACKRRCISETSVGNETPNLANDKRYAINGANKTTIENNSLVFVYSCISTGLKLLAKMARKGRCPPTFCPQISGESFHEL